VSVTVKQCPVWISRPQFGQKCVQREPEKAEIIVDLCCRATVERDVLVGFFCSMATAATVLDGSDVGFLHPLRIAARMTTATPHTAAALRVDGVDASEDFPEPEGPSPP